MNYIPLGEPVSVGDLRLRLAKEVVEAITQRWIKFVKLIGVRKYKNDEIIVVEFNVEVPSKPQNDIRFKELIEIIIFENQSYFPRAKALRKNFPLVAHLNGTEKGTPRDLCLWDKRFEEIASRLTGTRLLKRISEWLAETAYDSLHRIDQPLEPYINPLLRTVIVPVDYTEIDEENTSSLYVYSVDETKNFLWVTHKKITKDDNAPVCAAISYTCKVVKHDNVIRELPVNLQDLHNIVEPLGCDLIFEIRDVLKKWVLDGKLDKELLNSFFLIVVNIPLARDNENVEFVDIISCMTMDTVQNVGIILDAFQMNGEYPGYVLVDPDRNVIIEKAKTILLEPMNPVPHLSRDIARRMNGIPEENNNLYCSAVGVGALGSQFVLSMARSGFGKWMIIDNDRMYPHNYSRHALYHNLSGLKKVELVKLAAESVVIDNKVKAVDEDVMSPLKKDELVALIDQSYVVVDMSTTLEVSRILRLDYMVESRIMILFCNPYGNDLVCIYEDSERKYRVDVLELQYLRSICVNASMHEHLKNDIDLYRYGRGCSHVSAIMSCDNISLLSSIASKYFKLVVQHSKPRLCAWRINENHAVDFVDIQICDYVIVQCGNWEVVIDTYTTEQLFTIRNAHLPNETGGVLIGRIDVVRKVVYIAFALEAPVDSVESQTSFERGKHKLSEQIRDIGDNTMSQLEYVGEWHSHPKGVQPYPSQQDRKLFLWVSSLMAQDGLPAVMLIVGDNRCTISVEKLDSNQIFKR